MSPRKLTFLQERFVAEYIIDLNAHQAAKRAGYSAKTAQSQGARLLTNVDVQRAISAALIEQKKRTQIDADYVLRQSVKLHERCMQEVEPLLDKAGNPVTDEKGRPVWRFNANGAARSLELIGKHVGVQAFQEKAVVDVHHNYAAMTPAELDARIIALFRRPAPTNDTPS